MAKTPHFYLRGRVFNPWSKNKNPTSLEAWPKCKRKKSIGKTFRSKSSLGLLIKFKTLETKLQHLRTSVLGYTSRMKMLNLDTHNLQLY